MSRIGKQPITLSPAVQVTISGQHVKIKGPKGELTHEVPQGLRITKEEGYLEVQRENDNRETRALHGLTRSLVANMVEGVTQGFQRNLELVGTGYRASKSGNKLVLSVGYSHPVEIEPPSGLEIEVPTATTIVVKGSDKQAVGQLAARIRDVRKPEPYLGKGIRYQGEHVRRKVGKTGK